MSSTICNRCGFVQNWIGFHVCFNKENPEPKLPKKLGKMPQWQRDALQEAQKERWDRHREDTAKRDAELVEKYKQEGSGYRQLAKEYGISQSTVQKIVKEAEVRGEVVVRRRGHTFAKGAI